MVWSRRRVPNLRLSWVLITGVSCNAGWRNLQTASLSADTIRSAVQLMQIDCKPQLLQCLETVQFIKHNLDTKRAPADARMSIFNCFIWLQWYFSYLEYTTHEVPKYCFAMLWTCELDTVSEYVALIHRNLEVLVSKSTSENLFYWRRFLVILVINQLNAQILVL